VPRRPPKAWFDDCVAGVRARGGAVDPAAVCGAVWARKSPAEKRRATRFAEGGSLVSKKKKKAKKAKKKAPKRSKAKRPKKKTHHRCTRCRHLHKGPCLHMQGGAFCPCPRPVH
jgi:hypothetical protein